MTLKTLNWKFKGACIKSQPNVLLVFIKFDIPIDDKSSFDLTHIM